MANDGMASCHRCKIKLPAADLTVAYRVGTSAYKMCPVCLAAYRADEEAASARLRLIAENANRHGHIRRKKPVGFEAKYQARIAKARRVSAARDSLINGRD